ncbi:MAG: GNAT family N-acetyltransferase [Chloroflexi bacterium]|nr:GNAT family N-acetyltransferase [Chloroflexota bacterium]MBU1749410.1 GNAT family N-acetyltransferase [Chloroflexota bacterium]MBU1878182.1 GNAT family N-acetyltransferase [Chloroflexota bacterium]
MYNAAENLTIRHPSLDDAQATLDLMIACDVAEYGEPDSSLEDLVDEWSDIDLDQDAWLAIAPHHQLVGYTAVFGGDQRFIFDSYVHPTQAPDGLTKHLLTLCQARACEQLEVDTDTPTSVTASIIISPVNLADQQVAEELGFKLHRYHFGMRINLDAAPAIPIWPAGMTLRFAIPDQDDRAIYDFIQAAFDRPGRVVPSFERWRDFMMGAHNFESDLWFLAYQGTELIGAALCFDYSEYGWVRQLGVAHQWRRQGIGSALLRHTFGVFYQRGHTMVRLGVESDNPQAYQLYENVGMKRAQQYAEYSKILPARSKA